MLKYLFLSKTFCIFVVKLYTMNVQELTEFKELVDKGLSDKEISEVLNIRRTKVADRRFRNVRKRSNEEIQLLANKDRNYYNIFDNFSLMEVLVGTLLGDAWLTESSITSCRGGISHKEEHLEYLEFKYNKLREISNPVIFKKVDISKCRFPNSKIPKTVQNQYYFNFKASPYLKKLYNILYYNGRKVITNELLKYFTLNSLVYWFFDDGNLVKNKNRLNYYSYKIASYSFDLVSLSLMKDFLYSNFKIVTTIQSSNILSFASSSKDILKEQLMRFPIKCLQYKIGQVKSGELLGNPEMDNQQPSSEKDIKVSEKVQRLIGEESTNNPDTSAGHFKIYKDRKIILPDNIKVKI